MPPATLKRLYDAAQVAVRDEQVRQGLTKLGLIPVVDNTPQEFKAYILSENRKLVELVTKLANKANSGVSR